MPSRALGALCFFIVALSLDAQGVFYVSNQTGMAFEEIAPFRADEFDYTLEIVSAGKKETRIVREKGDAEFRRWVYERGSNGRVQSLSLYEREALTSVESYNSDGRITSVEYIAAEKTLEKTEYQYIGKRLASSATTDGEGGLIHKDEYFYLISGALRQVRRSYPDGRKESAGVDSSSGKIVSTWYTQGEKSIIQRLDSSGQIRDREIWQGEEALSIDSTNRSQEGLAENQKISDKERKLDIERRYGSYGELRSEITTDAKGKVVSRSDYEYDEDRRLVRKNFFSSGKRDRIEYAYGPDGKKEAEEHFQEGRLFKRVSFFPEGESQEELFQDGELAVRVYWKDGWKRREEILRGGKVIREREFK